jgi:hypothetical protein
MTSQVPVWRKAIAGGLGIVATLGLVMAAPREWWKLSLPMGLVLVSGAVVAVPRLGPQLAARAIWWSNLALGAVLALLGGSHERDAGAVLALACGGALLAIGRKGLAEASEREGYAPAAFRSSLLLLMVFALADAQTFLLFGIVSITAQVAGDHPVGPVLVALGVAYVVGFVGLYRMKLWAALLDAGVSLLALVSIPFLIPAHDREVMLFLALVAASHCLVAAPMLASLVTGRPLPALAPGARLIGQVVAISGLMLLSVIGWASH